MVKLLSFSKPFFSSWGFQASLTSGYVFYNNAFAPDGSVIRVRVGNREERRHYAPAPIVGAGYFAE